MSEETTEPQGQPEEKKDVLNSNAGCGGCLMFGLACFVILIIVIKCMPQQTRAPEEAPPAVEKKWNEGGSLHKATAEQWLAATAENRLATASDFVAATKSRFNFKNMTELQAYSIQMEACISKAAPAEPSQPVSGLAVTCALLLAK